MGVTYEADTASSGIGVHRDASVAARDGISSPERLDADPLDLPSGSDPQETLVEPGVYQVAFVRDERREIFGRPVWLVTFKIIEGEHLGRRLLFPLNALLDRHGPGRGHHIVQAFATSTGLRPPRDLWRLRPRKFLSDCVFRAEVRTVSRDSQKNELAQSLHYSRVQRLIERVAGVPPYLSKRLGR